jgi:hypothetical protein
LRGEDNALTEPNTRDEQPLLAEPREVEHLLNLAEDAPDISARLGIFSAALMGRPYVADSLVGGPDQPERLVTRLDAFDCVTYCDTVIALAQARDPGQFRERVVALRYLRGHIDWRARNHYTHSWLERNVGARSLAPLLLGLWRDQGAPRSLDILRGYPSLAWQPRYLPWSRRASLEACARTGDWLGFISRRPRLDTFHVGMLVVDGGLFVRHASRSRGQVIQEPLLNCMADWDVPGLFVARPLVPPTGARP